MGSERPDSGSGDAIGLLKGQETSTVAEAAITFKKAEEIADIHRQASAALDGDLEIEHPFRLLGRLRNLEPRHLQGCEILEALIMLRVITRTRPANTVGSLRRLKAMRERDGAPEKFKQFDARIKRHLGGRALSNHGYDKSNFEEMDHKPVWAQIKSHIDVLEQNNYQVFLNSGTLLGVVREGKLIAHDNDVDLAVILKARDTKEAAAEWLALGHLLAETGMLDKEQTEGQEIYKLPAVNGIQIDLFPCWIQDSRVYVYPHTCGEMRGGPCSSTSLQPS